MWDIILEKISYPDFRETTSFPFSWVCTWPLSAFIHFLRRISCIFKCWVLFFFSPSKFCLSLSSLLLKYSFLGNINKSKPYADDSQIYIYICYRLLWNLDQLIQFLILCLLFVLSGTQTFKIFNQKHILDIPISPVLGHYLAVKAENLSAILTFPSLLLSNPVMTNLSVLSPTYF